MTRLSRDRHFIDTPGRLGGVNRITASADFNNPIRLDLSVSKTIVDVTEHGLYEGATKVASIYLPAGYYEGHRHIIEIGTTGDPEITVVVGGEGRCVTDFSGNNIGDAADKPLHADPLADPADLINLNMIVGASGWAQLEWINGYWVPTVMRQKWG